MLNWHPHLPRSQFDQASVGHTGPSVIHGGLIVNLDSALTCQGMDTGPLGVSGTRALAGCEMGPPWIGHGLAGPNGCLIESGSVEFWRHFNTLSSLSCCSGHSGAAFCGVSEFIFLLGGGALTSGSTFAIMGYTWSWWCVSNGIHMNART